MDHETVAGLIAGIRCIEGTCIVLAGRDSAYIEDKQPEFVRALVSAARVGRSLGINLILATQKPSGVVDDEIMEQYKISYLSSCGRQTGLQ